MPATMIALEPALNEVTNNEQQTATKSNKAFRSNNQNTIMTAINTNYTATRNSYFDS